MAATVSTEIRVDISFCTFNVTPPSPEYKKTDHNDRPDEIFNYSIYLKIDNTIVSKAVTILTTIKSIITAIRANHKLKASITLINMNVSIAKIKAAHKGKKYLLL